MRLFDKAKGSYGICMALLECMRLFDSVKGSFGMYKAF